MQRKFSKNMALLFSGLALVLAPAVLLAGGFFEKLIKKPEIEVKDVLLQRISSRDAAFVTVLEIDNTTPLRAELAGVDYDFQLSGKRLARGETGKGLDVKPYDKASFDVPVEVTYENLKGIYDSSEGKDYLPYRVEGEVRVKSPWGDIPVPYKAKGRLPVVRPPRVRKVKGELKSLTFQKASVLLRMELENPNVFDLDIPRLNYDLDVKEKNFAAGTMQNQSVAKKTAGEIQIPVDLDLTGAADWIRDVLQGGSAGYNLQYDATYDIKGQKVHQKETVAGTLRF
ncbi:MAG: LEA type 2 family protein [bacterium]